MNPKRGVNPFQFSGTQPASPQQGGVSPLGGGYAYDEQIRELPENVNNSLRSVFDLIKADYGLRDEDYERFKKKVMDGGDLYKLHEKISRNHNVGLPEEFVGNIISGNPITPQGEVKKPKQPESALGMSATETMSASFNNWYQSLKMVPEFFEQTPIISPQVAAPPLFSTSVQGRAAAAANIASVFNKAYDDTAKRMTGQQMIDSQKRIEKIREKMIQVPEFTEVMSKGSAKDIGAFIAGSAVSTALSVAQFAVPVLGKASIFAQSFVESKADMAEEEAVKTGRDVERTLMEGYDPILAPTIAAGLELGLERIGNIKILSTIMGKAPKTFWEAVGKVTVTMGVEGLTEFLQAAKDHFITGMAGEDFYDTKAISETIENIEFSDLIDAGMRGVTGSGVLTGTGLAARRAQRQFRREKINEIDQKVKDGTATAAEIADGVVLKRIDSQDNTDDRTVNDIAPEAVSEVGMEQVANVEAEIDAFAESLVTGETTTTEAIDNVAEQVMQEAGQEAVVEGETAQATVEAQQPAQEAVPVVQEAQDQQVKEEAPVQEQATEKVTTPKEQPVKEPKRRGRPKLTEEEKAARQQAEATKKEEVKKRQEQERVEAEKIAQEEKEIAKQEAVEKKKQEAAEKKRKAEERKRIQQEKKEADRRERESKMTPSERVDVIRKEAESVKEASEAAKEATNQDLDELSNIANLIEEGDRAGALSAISKAKAKIPRGIGVELTKDRIISTLNNLDAAAKKIEETVEQKKARTEKENKRKAVDKAEDAHRKLYDEKRRAKKITKNPDGTFTFAGQNHRIELGKSIAKIQEAREAAGMKPLSKQQIENLSQTGNKTGVDDYADRVVKDTRFEGLSEDDSTVTTAEKKEAKPKKEPKKRKAPAKEETEEQKAKPKEIKDDFMSFEAFMFNAGDWVGRLVNRTKEALAEISGKQLEAVRRLLSDKKNQTWVVGEEGKNLVIIRNPKETTREDFISQISKEFGEKFANTLNTLAEAVQKLTGRSQSFYESDGYFYMDVDGILTPFKGMFWEDNDGDVIVSRKGDGNTKAHELVHQVLRPILGWMDLSKGRKSSVRALMEANLTQAQAEAAYTAALRIEGLRQTAESAVSDFFTLSERDFDRKYSPQLWNAIANYISENGIPYNPDFNYKGNKDRIPLGEFYGLTNIDEFSAESFSNMNFFAIVSNIKAPDSFSGIGRRNNLFGRLGTIFKDLANAFFRGSRIIGQFVEGQNNVFNALTNTLSEYESNVFNAMEPSQQTTKEIDNISAMLPKKADNINKEQAGKLLEYLKGKKVDLVKKDDYELFVSKVNDKLPEGSKISEETKEVAYNRFLKHQERLEKARIRSANNRLKNLEVKDLANAKDRLIDIIKNSNSIRNRFSNKQVNELLTKVRNLSDVNDYRAVFLSVNQQIESAKNEAQRVELDKTIKNIRIGASYIPANLRDFIRAVKMTDTTKMSPALLQDYMDFFENKKWYNEMGKLRHLHEQYMTGLEDFMNLFTEEGKEVKGRKNPLTVSNEEYNEMKAKLGERAAVLETQFNALEKVVDNDISGRPAIEQRAYIDFGVALYQFIQGFKSGDQRVDLRDFGKFETAVTQALDLGFLTNTAGQLVAKYVGKMKANEVAKKAEEVAKRKKYKSVKDVFATLSNSLSKMMTSSLIATNISKYATDMANVLNEHVYGVLKQRVAYIRQQHLATINRFADVIVANGVKEDGLKKLGIVGAIIGTKNNPRTNPVLALNEIKSKIDQIEKAVNNKIAAAEKSNVVDAKRVDLDEAKTEKKIFDSIKEAMQEVTINQDGTINIPDGVLSKGERAVLEHALGIGAETLPGHKFASNVFMGKEYEHIFNYVPMSPIGKVDGSDAKSFGDNLIDHLMKFDGTSFKDEGSYHTDRRHDEIRGTYYNFNLGEVMNKYVLRTLYDTHAIPEIQSLSSMMKDQGFIELLGANNVKVLSDSLKSAIEISRGNFNDYNTIVKALEQVRSLSNAGKLGNILQLGNQYASMLPSIVINHPQGVVKAMDVMRKMLVGGKIKLKDGRSVTVSEWVQMYGQGIQGRDTMFDRMPTAKEYAPILGPYRRFEKIADSVTTFVLRKSDAFAAYTNFFAAYFENGGSLEDPRSSKSRQAIANAERSTDLLQNISNVAFGPAMLKPTSSEARVLVSLLYTFKSFAVNQSMVGMSALYWSRNSAEARKMTAATAASIAFYWGIKEVMLAMYGGMLNFAGLIDDDEYEEKMEEKANGRIARVAANTLFDFFVGFVPDPLEGIAKAGLNSAYEAAYEHVNDETLERFSKPFFEEKGGPESFIGGYSPVAELAVDFWNNSIKYSQGDLDGDKFLRDTAIEAILFAKIIPFRGDISMFLRRLRTFQQEEGSPKGRSIPKQPQYRPPVTLPPTYRTPAYSN